MSIEYLSKIAYNFVQSRQLLFVIVMFRILILKKNDVKKAGKWKEAKFMGTSKISNLNRIFTRNMLRHFINGKEDNVYSSVVKRYTSNYVQKE